MKSILKKCVNKLLISVFSIFLIATITFFLFELMPGDIYSVDYIKSKIVINNIINKYGLARPLGERYLKMLSNLIHLDFGCSFVLIGMPVNDVIFSRFPLSAWLGSIAFCIATVNGIMIGAVVNRTKRKRISKWIKLILIICYSFPTFEIAALAQYVLCVKLRLFPMICSSNKSAMLLPLMLLSVVPTVNIARMTAAKMNVIDSEDYILAARLRKVSGVSVLLFYKLKNCIPPIITLLGSIFASMIAGSFVIETMFSIPGLGKFFITSVTNRDYPMVMGLTVFYAILIILINFIAELISLFCTYGKNGEFS